MISLALQQRARRVVLFFNDPQYYLQLRQFALPIALQQLVMSSLNMVSVMMIGQMGDVSVAAVGLANQVFFLLNLLLFGITSGSAIFTAQLWGRGDAPNIRRVLGLALALGLAAGGLFFVLARFFPALILGIYSTDPAVIELGSHYLRIFGWSYPFIAVSFAFASVLRSTGNVRLPLVVSLSALSLNTLLSYVLIFGKLGLPALGVEGAAQAGLFARLVECGAMLFFTYYLRTPAAASPRQMFSFSLAFISKVLKPIIPVIANEALWSLGITAYYVAYARIGTESVAAMNIVSTIDSLAMVIFIGVANACAILVGNLIGAGQEERAQQYALRSMALSMTGALGIGALILVSRDFILSFYKVSPQVIDYAYVVLTFIACLFWLRMSNLLLFIGIFRSGGDTRFAFLLDAVIIWVVGVPLAFAGAFVFHLPVYLVYLLTQTEEITKWLIGMWRFLSRKWIHNLAQTVSGN